MQTTLELPDQLYGEAKRAAESQGVSVEAFVAAAIEYKLRLGGQATMRNGRIQLPLVRSNNPGSINLTADRVAEILGQGDDSA